ncbi:MAG: hypothetical protein PHO02_06605 [Candidatus Nanoarchaeia archaeon]|nr:hypothetical protein [Candidatus Nanoarchaeia archaeon]
MKEFWNSAITEKSFDILLGLKKLPFEFVVIGGWAAYLWTKAHKSKDIDILLKNFEDMKYLRENYSLKKNDNLKKYEIKIEEIDIDIYVPFYSRLALPVEECIRHTARIEGIEVVSPEVLLILKQGAEIDRKDSVKGAKDRLDVMSLLVYSPVDFRKYFALLKSNKLESYFQRLKEIISSFKEIEYMGLNPRQFKLKKQEMLEHLKKCA